MQVSENRLPWLRPLFPIIIFTGNQTHNPGIANNMLYQLKHTRSWKFFKELAREQKQTGTQAILKRETRNRLAPRLAGAHRVPYHTVTRSEE
jgi:hypothetical protein